MFEVSRLMFMYVETPLHAGTGRSMGEVDLPIQRERITHYPIVQASGVKGALRSQTANKLAADTHRATFGPETNNANDHAGALSVGDARLLLFPVRSLAGVFAWTTSRDVLARFQRDAAMTGLSVGNWALSPLNEEQTFVSGKQLEAGGQVVLEEFSFTPQQNDTVKQIGTWLAQNALPQSPEYRYWREVLPQKLCILPENAFRDFVKYATEVQTHIKLDPEKKTVQEGALWTSENLPTDTLLYSALMATSSRAEGVELSGQQIIDALIDLKRLQVGGNETTGQGMVAVRMVGGEA
jgi:CRISPR-associated protein Cmr4